MSMQSRDLPPNYPRATTHKDSALLRRATLRKQRGPLERFLALFVLFIGVLGSVAAFQGGWGPLAALRPSFAALAAGLGVQALLTAAEWYYYDTKYISVPARLIDATLTYVGYAALALPWIEARLIARAMDATGAHFSAIALFALICYGIAWWPENRLID